MRPFSRLLLPVLPLVAMLAAPLPGGATLFHGIPPELRDEGAPTGRARIQAQPEAGTQAHTPDAHSPNMRLLANAPKSDAAPGSAPGFAPDFQSDLAFWGNMAFAGNYDGFKIIDISNPELPVVLANVSCRGPQNDISVWEDLVILSVDEPRTKPECDSLRASSFTDPNAWEGIRIFSLSHVLAATPDADGIIRSINPIAAPATDCGSHTHTLVPDLENDRLLVYVASYPLRSGPRCGPENAAEFGYDALHKKISIVEIPLRNPASARVIATPKINVPVFDIEQFPSIPPGVFNRMIGCHDIQVFLDLGLAAAACASAAQVWDISDPARPKTLEPLWTVDNPNVHFYHSGAFSWDGKITIFGDEVIEGTSCQSPSDMHGRLWFYRTKSGKERGSFLIPRRQHPEPPTPGAEPEEQYCTAHLFNVLRLEGRKVLVSSWYRGGTSVVDFTDPKKAKEIGFYDPAPMPMPAPEADEGAWSSYWYNGVIVSNNFNRGVDIFRIDHRAVRHAQEVDFDNPQTQLERLRGDHDDDNDDDD